MSNNFLPPPHSQSEPTAEYRYELKLAGAGISAAQARSWLRLHPEGFRTAFAPRIVNNLYFDTGDLQSFNDNLAGISARQKLRLRWYGVTAAERVQNPVLELKMKENMLGAKRQELLKLTLDLTQPYAEILKAVRAHVSDNWLPHLITFTQPVLINRYWREYFVSPDREVRATLDYELIAYDQRLASRPNLIRRLPDSPITVIEVKTAPENHKRLQEIMSYFPILRSQNSKYVQGVMGGSF